MTALSERIYEQRKKKGLSQSELAEKVGVSTKAVSKWETSEAQPTIDNVQRLATIFGVTSDYLLGTESVSQVKTNNGQNFQYLEDQKKKRHGLRIAGWIILGIGIFFDILGLTSFFSAFSGGGLPDRFFFLWIGFPLNFVGAVLLMFGYMGAVARYTASEQAPVQRDATNYILNGTREETTKTMSAVAQSLKTQDTKGQVCPKCGTQNEVGALYCDNCGAVLSKKCPSCGEVNDADAKHCRHCGKELF